MVLTITTKVVVSDDEIGTKGCSQPCDDCHDVFYLRVHVAKARACTIAKGSDSDSLHTIEREDDEVYL